jgi:RimJ/RimL family protein N-acetyltransferase
MSIVKTERLSLRKINTDDAAFILRLLNDPDFIQYVGDKKARDLESAKTYIQEGPVASYQNFGFGLYLVELNDDRAPIGICGILKRDFLDHAELGFALMPGYRGCGYAFEAAQATKEFARIELKLSRVVAITAANNSRSIKLLEKLGLSFDRMFDLPAGGKSVKLYSCSL